MKKIFLGVALLSFFTMINVNQSFAQTTPTTTTAKTPAEFSKEFFDLYSTKPMDAIDYIFAQQKVTRDMKNDIVDIKRNLKMTIAEIGNYDGYELITEKDVNNTLRLMSYIVKYDKSPIRITLIYYKPKDVWSFYTFQYNTNLENELTNSAVLENLKLGAKQ